MKEESRKILDELIREHSCRYSRPSGLSDKEYESIDTFNEHEDKIENFLKSIPQIESHLCKGGYIQDKNGTPCCDGDEVVFTYYADCINVPKKKGQLRWSPYHRFIIIANNEEYDFMDNEIIEFEKITEEKQ